MGVEIRPLGDPLGTEVSGIDLGADNHENSFQIVLAALLDRQVVVVRNQNLSPDGFARFASHFGNPQPHILDHLRHPERPEILPLSNVFKDGKPVGVYDGAAYWHTDMSYEEDPAFATLVYSIKAPQQGGDTRFANLAGAYDALPEATKRKIAGLVVKHHYGNRADINQKSRTGASELNEAQKAKVKNVYHPLVKEHPISGRKALYAVAGSSMGIEGWPDDEAVSLLDELASHATQPAFVHDHHYEVGDVVIWDDYATLHSATLTPPATCAADTRLLHRISVTGLPVPRPSVH